MERRVVASAIDLLLLFIVLAVFLAVVQALGINDLLVAAAIPVLFIGYHATAVLYPHVGLGRTVAAITVASTKRGAMVTPTQAIIRALARTVCFGTGIAVAVGASLPWLAVAPPLLDLALISFTPWRQSVADVIAATIVVNTPPLQPHWAPAVPMFSKDDAEFGHPPRKGG